MICLGQAFKSDFLPWNFGYCVTESKLNRNWFKLNPRFGVECGPEQPWVDWTILSHLAFGSFVPSLHGQLARQGKASQLTEPALQTAVRWPSKVICQTGQTGQTGQRMIISGKPVMCQKNISYVYKGKWMINRGLWMMMMMMMMMIIIIMIMMMMIVAWWTSGNAVNFLGSGTSCQGKSL